MVRLGVDVGGTFTDFVAYDPRIGKVYSWKSPTTPLRPWEGVLEGIRRGGVDLGQVEVLVHATTLGTNLFLGQVGLEVPGAALITNEGFRDVIEIGRQNRPSLYNPRVRRPPPLIPRRWRIGVKGRILSTGDELEPLDVESVRRWASRLCGEGVRVFVVSFLHSYVNPSHERLAASIVREECPEAVVVLGSEVDPQPLEYERTSTAVVNALLHPTLAAYLERLQDGLRRLGFRGVLLVMQSNGGLSGVEVALRMPAAFIESGPAAGAVGVAYLSMLLGVNRALGFDMGGTTAKASSIIEGEPLTVGSFEVGGKVHMGRPVPGSGYPVRYPHIDLAEVSAGGGTIAWVDPGGALRLGPISAGADPGPACYGKGGSDPTVTDANLVLGRLPTVLAGGLKLSVELAWKALREKVAGPLGMDVYEAALAVVGLANNLMARALRLVSVERGLDPREFTLFAFGGAGPLHAVEIAEELGVGRVVVPPYAGVFSALGLLFSDYRHSLHAPINRRASELSPGDLEQIFQDLEKRADKMLEAEGVPGERRVFLRYVEARYEGQAYTLRIPYPGTPEAAARAFEEAHRSRYGYTHRSPIVLALARLEAIGRVEKPRLRPPTGVEAHTSKREVLFREGWFEAEVVKRESFPKGYTSRGPMVIEAEDTTILVPPRKAVRVGGLGEVVIEVG
ncbi:MAG: hydantoinase/oxoprolinase family protein [Desulfurococcales archaeon]|nr:hydantoinase/oxoprolinase family protein [Desulfurococcales archaeon]